MTLDWQADQEHAEQYDILDAATFQSLPEDMPIFYADDSRGVLRVLKPDAEGNWYVAYEDDHVTPVPDSDRWRRWENGRETTRATCVAWEEIRKPIRIVRKAP
jgi:hypothetical protein